jgi:hypothetical protein
MTLAARKHRAAVVEVEMSGLQNLDVDQPNIALPADDLLSRKSQTFAHPDEVVDDQELKLADKRSLLASWASDALAVEDSPSLRQLASGAVVCVDDVRATLKSLDLDEPRHEAAATFFQSFPRRRSKPAARRLKLRPEDDDEPPPHAASARIPTARSILIAGNEGNRTGTWSDVANGACGFRHR